MISKDNYDAAIVFLLNNHTKDIFNFRKSIELLIKNYCSKFPTDIICFHEPDFPESELYTLKSVLENLVSIYFHKIEFKIPDYPQDLLNKIPKYYPHPDFPNAQGFSIGYRHMCRFFAGEIFKLPILSKYKYIWRLDTDSFLLSDINYNIFHKLYSNRAIYGYINIQHDHPGVVQNLWELSEIYFKKYNQHHTVNKLEKNRMFYTNFEVLDKEWFLQDDYQNYYKYIDDTGGIYTNRWGDAPIRYIALKSLAQKENLYFYHDIRYFHQREFYNTEIIDTFNVN